MLDRAVGGRKRILQDVKVVVAGEDDEVVVMDDEEVASHDGETALANRQAGRTTGLAHRLCCLRKARSWAFRFWRHNRHLLRDFRDAD